MSIKREVKQRKNLQENLMRKLARYPSSNFKVGDIRQVHNPKTGVWDVKGEVERVSDHQGEGEV